MGEYFLRFFHAIVRGVDGDGVAVAQTTVVGDDFLKKLNAFVENVSNVLIVQTQFIVTIRMPRRRWRAHLVLGQLDPGTETKCCSLGLLNFNACWDGSQEGDH